MKILVTGALGASPDELEKIKSLGHELTLHPDEREPVANPEFFDAAICNGLFLYNEIEKFSRLRYIQLTSAGTDRVPADYVRSRGITLKNAAGVYAVPMAEWTLMRILELYKNAKRLFDCDTWEKDRTWRELSGKTACIVGFGAYGRETAKRLSAFGVHIIAVNRSEKPGADEIYPLERLDEALAAADIVVMALALTAETRHIMNAERFAAMKPGAVFINAARGDLVDEAALLSALRGKLSGAALDVFSSEPLPAESPLRRAENLLLSPHNSFVGEGNHRRLMALVLQNLADCE